MTVQLPVSDVAESSNNVTELIQKLDSIAEFYQQQLDWVDDITRIVETESEDEEQPDTAPLTSRRMHWRRQMRSLESKLNGGKAHRNRRRSRQPDYLPSSTNAEEHILNGFGRIMGARMESCRRVQKLLALTKRYDDV